MDDRTLGDNLATVMAQELTRVHADLQSDSHCTAVLVAARSHFLLREILAGLDEAMAIAEAELMNSHCARELAALRAELDTEMGR